MNTASAFIVERYDGRPNRLTHFPRRFQNHSSLAAFTAHFHTVSTGVVNAVEDSALPSLYGILLTQNSPVGCFKRIWVVSAQGSQSAYADQKVHLETNGNTFLHIF